MLAISPGAEGFRSHSSLRDCSTTERWMVVHTKSRQEKALAEFFENSGRSFYLPLVSRVTMIRGRKVKSNQPLFPGYVFLLGERDDGFAAISTKRACQIITIADQERFEFEISQIATALEEGAGLELYPFAVKGRWCRVRKGPFMGLEGWVVERLSTTRLILHIGILGRGAALEIDIDFLEPID